MTMGKPNVKKVSVSNDATVTREFGGFERLELRDRTNWVDLIIEPGEREALVIEGPPEILTRIKTEVQAGTLKIALGGNLFQKVQDALTTSLSRKKVRYHLTAKRLTEVKVFGMVNVDVSAFGKERPTVKYAGPVPPNIPVPPTHS
jgi:hypothetical protein